MHHCTLRFRQAALAAGLLVALVAHGHPAAAQAPADPVSVAFTMPTPGQIVSPGSTVLFDASFLNATAITYIVDDATFTSTDPTVNSEVSGGLISGFFDGSDNMGSPVTVAPGPTSQSGIFELDLDPSLPGGQPIAGTISFTGYNNSDPNQTPIEVASQSFAIETAPAVTPPVAPEPASVATFAITALFAAGLMLKARRRTVTG